MFRYPSRNDRATLSYCLWIVLLFPLWRRAMDKDTIGEEEGVQEDGEGGELEGGSWGGLP
jgi:hypothetical protein